MTSRALTRWLPLVVAAVVGWGVVISASCAFAQRSESSTQRAVLELLLHRREGRAIPRLPSAVEPWTLNAAYRVQDRLAELEKTRLGAVVAHKVAYASAAAQQQFGVDEPASGPFFAVQRIEHGGSARAQDFRDLLMETEVAFVLRSPLGGRVFESVDQLQGMVRSVHPALDVGDFPYAAGLRPSPADIVAAGVGAHRFVLGPGFEPRKIDLKSLQLRLFRDGEQIRSSPASEVMGDPWESLRWFVNSYTARGHTLLPGTVVLTGTAAPAYRTNEPDAIRGEYLGDCGALGRVRLRIE